MSDTGEEPKSKQIRFIHTRLPSFRCIHADSAWGSINGQGNIALAFYNERPPLPQSMTYEYDANGNLLPTQESAKAVSDYDVLRQFEAEIIMSFETAKVVHTILGNFIKMREKADEIIK